MSLNMAYHRIYTKPLLFAVLFYIIDIKLAVQFLQKKIFGPLPPKKKNKNISADVPIIDLSGQVTLFNFLLHIQCFFSTQRVWY